MEKPTPVPAAAEGNSPESSATPLRCFTGSLLSGTLALAAYRLTLSIAANFASKPVTSSNPAVVNISAAVRTLVTGMVALGASVFGIAAVGLMALGIQLLVQNIMQKFRKSDALPAPAESESTSNTPIE